MQARAFFIVNPHSANGRTARRWPAIKQAFEAALGPLDFTLTKGNMHATYLTGQALYDGYERIIAVGGDGTLNEVVNGFYDSEKKISERAVLGYYPSGTGQDFSLTLGIDRQDLNAHVARLLNGRPKMIDLGEATFRQADGKTVTRRFINESSLGFAANVARHVNESTKVLGGKATFILGLLRNLLFLQNHRLKIEVEGKEYFHGRALIVTLANGRYLGGSMMIAPRAEIDDGFLEIVLVGEMGRLEILCNFPGIYRGRHLANPKVRCLRGKRIRIASAEQVWLEMDGELVGLLGAEFCLREQEMPFIV